MLRAAREVGEANVRENAQAGVQRAEDAARYLDVAGSSEDGSPGDTPEAFPCLAGIR